LVALAARDRLMKFASRPVKGRDETELDRIGSISKKLVFRQIQRARFPHLSRHEWIDLFQLWTAHYRAREDAKREAARLRFAELIEQRRSLFIARAFMPGSDAAAANTRLLAIGHELAALCVPRRPAPPLGSWV
jgi:hypothetical protein